MIYAFTALWTTLVGFNSAWSISEKLTHKSIWFDTPWILLPVALALLPASKTIYDLIKGRKKK